jgi:hypothetical protein
MRRYVTRDLPLRERERFHYICWQVLHYGAAGGRAPFDPEPPVDPAVTRRQQEAGNAYWLRKPRRR